MLWGVSTVVFPMVACIRVTSIAVVMVILADAVMLGSALLAVSFGLLTDRWDERRLTTAAVCVSAAGGVLLSLVEALSLLALTGFLWQAFSMAASLAAGAWFKDLLPA